ncbi:MAG: hypothetical protein VR64_23770 [Desulfatitalea sp. BRH_c12]|nr:MAG: hypothetical protein VR64_23770 [Desulfatitalea sp. BRH_c12]
MVKFRFSIILLCVLLPPLFYVFTVQLLESHSARRIQAGLEEVYLGDIQPLLDGSRRIQVAINENVDAFLKRNRWIAWGAKAIVSVRTADNTLLYPLSDPHGAVLSAVRAQPMEVAVENYRLLNEKPTVILEWRLPHNCPITNTVLAFYTFIGIGLLYLYYRHWKSYYQREMESNSHARRQLIQKGEGYEQQLIALQKDRARLDQEMRQAHQKLTFTKHQAETSQEKMIEEIIALEEEIAVKVALQNQQQASMDELQHKLGQLESQLQKEQLRKSKSSNGVQKRFAALYKNLEITEKAMDGYLDLTEDMKIKCEEIIRQLDVDSSKLPIKRKVFGKKNRETVFEVAFGYRGRLYYLPRENKKYALLAVGTKNSQQQDLEYLNRL